MLPRLSSRSVNAFVSATVEIVACPRVTAASLAVWQIGKFDHSSAEFNQAAAEPHPFRKTISDRDRSG